MSEPAKAIPTEETPARPEIHAGMTIREIMAEAHRNALAHGFWEQSDNFGEKIALIHSELSEFLEAWLAGETEDETLVELADAQIRTADLAEHLGLDLEAECARLYVTWEQDWTIPGALARIHRLYSLALEAHRENPPDMEDVAFNLARGWAWIEVGARAMFRGDLREIRAAKLIKNRWRKKLHGKRY